MRGTLKPAWGKKLPVVFCVFSVMQTHQWAEDYFLVRMVVPGTKPVENPCVKSPNHMYMFDVLHMCLLFSIIIFSCQFLYG